METVKKQKNLYGIMMVVNAAFFALLHSTFVGFTNDDAYFVIVRDSFDSLWELLVHRYITDSSRVLSEAVLFTLVKYPFAVWQILDTLICALVYHCLTVLLVNDKTSRGNVVVFLLFACYPFMHMGSAGWICTSLNYLWPLATLLYALTIVYRKYRKEKVALWQYLAGIMAMIFTANCEMSATMLVMVFACAIVFVKKKCPWYEILGTLIGLAGIIFAFSAPGNDERTAMEAMNWMPEFFNLTFLDKARLCAVFVFEHFVMIPDMIFFLFALCVALAGWKKENAPWKNIIAVIPLFVDVLFTGCYFVKDFLIGRKTNYDFTTPAIFLTDGKTKFIQFSEIAGLMLFIIASVYTIWLVMERREEKDWRERYRDSIICIWALGCGFAVRMALMLSPTMFSSWHRTLIFMYFAFLYNIAVLYRQISKRYEKNRFVRVAFYGLLAIGIAINLVLTVGLQIRKSGM